MEVGKDYNIEAYIDKPMNSAMDYQITKIKEETRKNSLGGGKIRWLTALKVVQKSIRN